MSRPDGRGDHAEQQPTERLATVWGPLSMQTTSAVGAHAPVSSFVVQPALAAELEAALCAEVLRDALPGPDETRETLLQRLTQTQRRFRQPAGRVRSADAARLLHAPERSDATPRRPGKAGHFCRAIRTGYVGTAKIEPCADPCRTASVRSGMHSTPRYGRQRPTRTESGLSLL